MRQLVRPEAPTIIEKLTTIEIRKRLGDILDRVSLRHDQFIIERKGKPLAAVIPVEKLEQLERLARLQIARALAAGGGASSETDIDALADEAKHRGRKSKAKCSGS